ncbi:MAG: hypothetical protein GYB31_03510 [Bacteroidetes bacterium]|nr:hypothetical protein [Bacteroidota bacterium]
MKYCLPLLCLLLLQACASEVQNNKEPLTANFYMRYLADGQEYKAEATFLKNTDGTQEAVEMKGGVSFQGSAMGKRVLSDQIIRYQYENSGTFPEKITFACKRESAEPWINFELKMIPVRRFNLPDTIGTANPAPLILPDGPLTAEEELVLIFSDPQNKAQSITLAGPSEGNSILLPVNQITKLGKGINTIYLVKKQRQKINKEGIDATVELEYYSQTAATFVE